MLSRLLLDLFVSTNTVTSATKATSAQDVFGIYELLEGILLHLPLYNMLLAVTTCRHWLHVASTSSEIRSRLLLDYIPRYARLQPSSRVSEDLCNEDSSTPWFFRTAVEGGTIVILRLKCEKVQVFVPRDVNAAFRLLDNQGMLVATRQTVQSRISRLIWYDRNGEFVCAKRTPYKYPFHLADDMEIYRITFRKEVTIKILGE